MHTAQPFRSQTPEPSASQKTYKTHRGDKFTYMRGYDTRLTRRVDRTPPAKQIGGHSKQAMAKQKRRIPEDHRQPMRKYTRLQETDQQRSPHKRHGTTIAENETPTHRARPTPSTSQRAHEEQENAHDAPTQRAHMENPIRMDNHKERTSATDKTINWKLVLNQQKGMRTEKPQTTRRTVDKQCP